ncbi:tyrosine-type recombinase/integrase [Modestobacter sp. VKM Ac-2985]|uniref:tyrosine-type recombinase/integrase n=1 Tax=Modestobacter sp. VKM Ac-2985 TaxID=3004139 RepID=UPI0022AB7517|nr:site-specific integrase [Modestobacter sp. VKM Ac-2985]MCZ2837085.1 site-specific integrase [Modestobacter sp. VKM Ac-2985]
MPRPQLDLGAWGQITLTGYVYDENGKAQVVDAGARRADYWVARATVRDNDGKHRTATKRSTKSKADARTRLETALRERTTPAPEHAAVKPTTKVADVARAWLVELEDSDRSTNTRQVYRLVCNRQVIGTPEHPSSLANLTVREVTTGGVERFLRGVAKASGPGAAKTTRTVLRGVLDLATHHDAIPFNPVRQAGPTQVRTEPKGVRDAEGYFTVEQRDAVMAYADADPVAKRRDLADVIAFLAGTGARIAEVCALRWSSLDLAEGMAKLGPVVVRERGVGLHIQDDGKTDSSTRTIKLPPWLVARLMARQVNAAPNDHDVVFPSARAGALRDAANTSNHVSELLTAAGHPWATAHTFRHTVCTLLGQAGLLPREVANYVGHKHASMTMDRYMSRQTVSERTAALL